MRAPLYRRASPGQASTACDNAGPEPRACRHRCVRTSRQRGLIADVTTPAELDAHLAEAPRTVYVGFDPTADSLHVGSLVPLLALRRCQLAGHRPIVLVGGGTGLIGDPAGKTGERALNAEDHVAACADRLKAQVRPFLDFDQGPHAAILVDNYEWLSRLELIPFLRDIGKHFSVGAMIARESVRARLGAGISYTEFSYQVLQAYDFLALHERHGCTLQMGGSDQWGNITAGTELIRRVARGRRLRPHPAARRPRPTGRSSARRRRARSGSIRPGRRRTRCTSSGSTRPTPTSGGSSSTSRSCPRPRSTTSPGRRAAAPEKREAQRVLAREVTRLVHGEDGQAGGGARPAERAVRRRRQLGARGGRRERARRGPARRPARAAAGLARSLKDAGIVPVHVARPGG